MLVMFGLTILDPWEIIPKGTMGKYVHKSFEVVPSRLRLPLVPMERRGIRIGMRYRLASVAGLVVCFVDLSCLYEIHEFKFRSMTIGLHSQVGSADVAVEVASAVYFFDVPNQSVAQTCHGDRREWFVQPVDAEFQKFVK